MPVYPVGAYTLSSGATLSEIQTALDGTASETAVYLNAGTYTLSGTLTVPDKVVLRGAGIDSEGVHRTIITGVVVQFGSGSTSVSPAITYGLDWTGYGLSGTPTKGDTTLTLDNAGDASVGQWISVYGDNDPSLVTNPCNWCGNNSDFHVLQQIVQVTAKDGSEITISKPLYYTIYGTPEFSRFTIPITYAGLEDLKLDLSTRDISSTPIIKMTGSLFCWVKGVETYMTGGNSSSAHVYMRNSYGNEVRNSYFHYGRSSASGANYGLFLARINTDHKIENNVYRHNRHSIVFEGGGSGIAILYNYIDDQYTDDLSYLGNSRTNHGAHPYMNLLEGNIISAIMSDDIFGSSSHDVFFRNWIWGDETGTDVPSYPPYNGYVAINIEDEQRYYSFVGNVLGMASPFNANWDNATLLGSSLYPSAAAPFVYSIHSNVRSITIKHGNWDYLTDGVAYWDGGADHDIKDSYYYASKPDFFGSETWPPIDGTNGTENTIPAKIFYDTGSWSTTPTNTITGVSIN